jgi:hypothetical protein
MGAEMDEFAVLGVPRYATADQIKAAYRERARFLHPDRHVREDGTVPMAVQDAFVRLNKAFRTAMAHHEAALAVTIPQQRTPTSGSRQAGPARSKPAAPVVPLNPVTQFVPGQRKTGIASRPAPDQDPMLTLLTLPQRCRTAWPREALATWALTLVPAARPHLAEARRLALHAGALAERHRSSATAHVLLTLTVSHLRAGRRMRTLAEHLPSAYDALEAELPPAVVERLPARVGIGRGGLGSLLR